ncbi:MAG: hypothetical protein ACE15B_01610 [Bryobacteraceae bacterium]
MTRLLVSVFCACALAAQSRVEVVNNLPYAVRLPVGDILVQAPAAGGSVIILPQKPVALLDVAPEAPGLRLRCGPEDAGRLAWALIVKPAGALDHASLFEPLPLAFKRSGGSAMYSDWKASARRSGFEVALRARVWRDGFLDWSMTLRNDSAERLYGMYGAVVARWEHPAAARRMLAYDNRAEELDRSGKTRFSAGKDRHHALQHGLDWMALDFRKSAALVLNGFDPLSTTLDDTQSVRNKSPRFLNTSLPQFKNEAQAAGGALYLIGEFARENRPYRDRFVESCLPGLGRAIRYGQRIVFSAAMPSREAADAQFTAYNTWTGRAADRIEIGVPGVVFGTSYFPYSTLGENFGDLKLPGQQTDAYWPLSADTVTRWKDFAPDIRRDLRIAKAMGFSVIRLHYVDVISKLPEAVQFEYLDFLFAELRRLRLRAMFSTAFPYWSPEQIAARVARYRDVIGRVEIENEVLIWGIPLDRPQYWARIYDAVKKAAPEVQVHWTGHFNTGIFDRLDDLRLRYDAVGAHSYIDALDAIPSGRGFALAAGNYASRKGKDAIYTEWNWRGLTRMTPEARARVYPPIMENLLATRSIRELYPFQFQQTMCVNPHTRKGIRQYEPLWLSRRPKPEGFELMKLIERYSLPEAPNRVLAADHPVLDLARPDGEVRFRLRNRGPATLRLAVSVECDQSLRARVGRAVVRLTPGAEAEVPVRVTLAPGAKPGFYHLFLRLEGENGFLRYGWGEVRKPGQPEGAAFDLNRPVTVIYGENCPNIEMEAAYLLAATIESASGRPAALYSAQDAPQSNAGAVITVGMPAAPGPNRLALAGYEESVRFALEYWMHAKDSGARRVGLVRKKLAAGADVANLP